MVSHTERNQTRNRLRTSTLSWSLLVLVNLVLVTLQVPHALEALRDQVPADLVQKLNSPQIVDLALKIGSYAAVAVYAGALALYGLLSGKTERRIGVKPYLAASRFRFGPLFATVACVTVPVQLFCLINNVTVPKRQVAYYLYLLIVTVALCLLARRRQYRHGADASPKYVYTSIVVLSTLVGMM